MDQSAEKSRKSPTQSRAQETVSTIFEATAQLLERSGDSDITTNHVAERAGFSIGTLYRYFSSKASLFNAMAIHEMERQERDILAALAESRADRVEDIVRILVRHALKPFAGRLKVRRRLLRHMAGNSTVPRRFDQMIERLTDALHEKILVQATDRGAEPGPEARFIMFRAAIGAIRAAVMFRDDMLARAAFEDELVAMIASFYRRP
ncbi:MAG: hypothetical protein RLZZ444_752 [Pseudomonadota bacterium]